MKQEMQGYISKKAETHTKTPTEHMAGTRIGPTFQFVDNRPRSVAQRKEMAIAANVPTVVAPIQSKPDHKGGLPAQLKHGIESLSGYAMDDVKVHYNSSKPAQLHAHAYAQGSEIHLAPGQEKHLPHEAWHVAQQKQGRVKPTMQMKGRVAVNDDKALETEADVMGAKATNYKTTIPSQRSFANTSSKVTQHKCAACEAKLVAPKKAKGKNIIQRVPCADGKEHYYTKPENLKETINSQNSKAMKVDDAEAHVLCCTFCIAQMEGISPTAELEKKWSARAEQAANEHKNAFGTQSLYFEESFYLAKDPMAFAARGLVNESGIFKIDRDFYRAFSTDLGPVYKGRITYTKNQIDKSGLMEKLKEDKDLKGEVRRPDVVKVEGGKVQPFDIKFDYKKGHDLLHTSQAVAYNRIATGTGGSKPDSKAENLPLITAEQCNCKPDEAFHRIGANVEHTSEHAHYAGTVAAASASSQTAIERASELAGKRQSMFD